MRVNGNAPQNINPPDHSPELPSASERPPTAEPPRPAVCPFLAPPAPVVPRPVAPGAKSAESRTAAQQQAWLYKRVQHAAYAKLPELRWEYAGALGGLRLVSKVRWSHGFQNNLKETFTNAADIRPARTKVFHPFGVVGAARFEATETTPFTGLFQSGAPALVRLSLATDMSGYTPGAAIKLFVDRQPSLNVHAIPGLDPQTSHDFFANDFTNWIPKATERGAQVLESSLGRIVSDPNNLPVTKLAEIDTHGVPTAGTALAPKRLILRGTKHTDAASQKDFRSELTETLTPGDTLFNVFGVNDADQEIKIGRIVLTEPLVASRFGDEELHFEHNTASQIN